VTDRLTSHDPRTGLVIDSVDVTPPEELPAIVERSRKAFAGWSALTHDERRRHLKDWKQFILAHGEEIAQLIRSEAGKPLTEAYGNDVLTTLTVLDHYVRLAEKYLRPRKGNSWPFLTVRGWTEYHPRGVAGVIGPWNYPFFLPMIPIATALAAGCSVVFKPSELTPLTGRWIGESAAAAGLPADLVQVIQGGGEVGAALVSSGVDVVSFTGSTKVGRMVAVEAAKNLTPVVLELGGKDAMVVLEDADLKRAAGGAVFGAMVNAGQACISVERLYVVQSVYDRFLDHLSAAFDGVSPGSGDGKDIGPMISPRQIEVVESHVADALAKGAKVLKGGHRVDRKGGVFFEPTLLVDVDHSMLVMQEETFGPVLAIMAVRDEETALAAANDCGYGLHGSVWTTDDKRGARFASQMRTGTVAVNDVAVNFITPNLAFGGVGESGIGSNFGPDGIKSYCYPKSITSSRLRWPTTRLLGAWYPRRRPMAYWKALAKVLFRW